MIAIIDIIQCTQCCQGVMFTIKSETQDETIDVDEKYMMRLLGTATHIKFLRKCTSFCNLYLYLQAWDLIQKGVHFIGNISI